MSLFRKATKTQAKLRLLLSGPSGSGKTYTSLLIAHNLAANGKVAVVDSEHGSAAKYAGQWNFDTFVPDNFHPRTYVKAIEEAGAAGYDVIVLDSITHEWQAVLEIVDGASARLKSNSYAAWKVATPEHQRFVDAIVRAKLHVIATVRSKTEYVLEEDERGRKVPRKIGMAPVQRDGLEYEFDVFAELDQNNTLFVTKTRCVELRDYVERPATANVATILKRWLEDGEPAALVETPRPLAAAPSKAFERFMQLISTSPVEHKNALGAEIARAVKAGELSDAERFELQRRYAARFAQTKAEDAPSEAPQESEAPKDIEEPEAPAETIEEAADA